ncbi:MAG: hypothetical protein VX941_08615 [Pseudomonadota bacterium]|nr:hypothetical protein [Pseudomonadota bacterium]
MKLKKQTIYRIVDPVVKGSIEKDGKQYTLIAQTSHITKGGRQTTLFTWQTHCTECGLRLEFKTGPSRFSPVNRCSLHKKKPPTKT